MRAVDSIRVARTLGEHGVAVAANLFAGKMARLAKHAQTQAPALLTPDLLGDDLLSNVPLMAVVDGVLGVGAMVARVNVGAEAAACLATTAERARLFEDDAATAAVPVFSVSGFAPLQACTVVVTAQGLQQEIGLSPGDALLIDSRCHARVTDVAAAALFVTFTRPWFREPQASPLNPPVLVSSFDYLRLPPALQARLQWRFDRYLKQRPRLIAYRVADKVPAGLGAPVKRALRGWASSY
ncbi:MAG: hypothetical protein SF187_13475 [Deltaproteobacteria bacterium]|nr:hypothetical protein [Deltaproteobacteria bacterium]